MLPTFENINVVLFTDVDIMETWKQLIPLFNTDIFTSIRTEKIFSHLHIILHSQPTAYQDPFNTSRNHT